MWLDTEVQWRHLHAVDERTWEILRATEVESYHSLRRVIASALAWAEDHPAAIAAYGGPHLDDYTLQEAMAEEGSYRYWIPLSEEEWARLEGLGRLTGVRLLDMTLSVVVGEWAVAVDYEPRWSKDLLADDPVPRGHHRRTLHKLSPLAMQALHAGERDGVVPEEVVMAACHWAADQADDLLIVHEDPWESVDGFESTRWCVTLTLPSGDWRRLERVVQDKEFCGLDLAVLLEAWALAGWPGVSPAGYPQEVEWQRTPRYWARDERGLDG